MIIKKFIENEWHDCYVVGLPRFYDTFQSEFDAWQRLQ